MRNQPKTSQTTQTIQKPAKLIIYITEKNDSFPLYVNILENNGILRIPFKFHIMEVAVSIIYYIPYNGINLNWTAITGNNGISMEFFSDQMEFWWKFAGIILITSIASVLR